MIVALIKAWSAGRREWRQVRRVQQMIAAITAIENDADGPVVHIPPARIRPSTEVVHIPPPTLPTVDQLHRMQRDLARFGD